MQIKGAPESIPTQPTVPAAALSVFCRTQLSEDPEDVLDVELFQAFELRLRTDGRP